MTLYLDCEFNSFGGELISIALVSTDPARVFYEALQITSPVDPWVAEHVMPILMVQQMPVEWVQGGLQAFLSQWPEVHIIADWPEDIAYFCKLCITGPGKRIRLPRLTFEIVTIDAPSDLPHNALFDAKGIAKAHSRV